MSIGSISSQRYASIDSVQSTAAVSPTTEPVTSTDGDASVRGHRRAGGHGGIGQAVMDALQSLGVSMPAPPGPPPADSVGNPASDSTVSDSQSPSGAGTADIRRDVKQLMGALFEALQGAVSASGTGSTAATSGGASGSSFAASLSTLISQSANGSAPSGLQDAFTKLTTDLKAASGGTSTTSTSASTSTETTLQAFLSKLQDRLGYGAASSATTTGSLISATA